MNKDVRGGFVILCVAAIFGLVWLAALATASNSLNAAGPAALFFAVVGIALIGWGLFRD